MKWVISVPCRFPFGPYSSPLSFIVIPSRLYNGGKWIGKWDCHTSHLWASRANYHNHNNSSQSMPICQWTERLIASLSSIFTTLLSIVCVLFDFYAFERVLFVLNILYMFLLLAHHCNNQHRELPVIKRSLRSENGTNVSNEKKKRFNEKMKMNILQY